MEASKSKRFGTPVGKEFNTTEEYQRLQAMKDFDESAKIGHRAVKRLIKAVALRYEAQNHPQKWDFLTPTYRWQHILHQLEIWLAVELMGDGSRIPVTACYGYILNKDDKPELLLFHNTIGDDRTKTAWLVARMAFREAWSGRRILLRAWGQWKTQAVLLWFKLILANIRQAIRGK